MNRIAVVTGANRGIGREVARQLADVGDTIYLTARNLADADAAVADLGSPANLHSHQLDVTDPGSIDRLAATIEADHHRLDILINNAAIMYDIWQRASAADLGVVREALETNLFGAWRVTLALLPLLRRSGHARIVNVSSGAGSLTYMGGGTPAYGISKVALNALTRMLAAELRGDRILVNAVDPGWVATDMGGRGGGPVADGAAGIVWAADLPDSGPTGGFFYDSRPAPW